MEQNIQEAKLKNGKYMGVTKIEDKFIFLNLVMARWQLALLVFIVITSILSNVIVLNFIGEIANTLLYEIKSLHLEQGTLDEVGAILFNITRNG